MRGILKGLAARVLNDYPISIFSYCSGHSLNLILQDICKGLQCVQALDIVKSIVGYIRHSQKREAAFDSFIRFDYIEAAAHLPNMGGSRHFGSIGTYGLNQSYF